MKGVILAGGSGTRLHPLTRITNKHLLPIYDRPMVTYAVEALVSAEVRELMVVTGGTHAGERLDVLERHTLRPAAGGNDPEHALGEVHCHDAGASSQL